MRSPSESEWQVWVDTGGTFTDCVAVDPAGQVCRAKVLSSSALRGTLLDQVDTGHYRIEEKWQAPDEFVTGFGFRLLGAEHSPTSVAAYDSQEHLLRLEPPLNAPFAKNATFEVCSPEEAPVLAARLVTKCTLQHSLPPMNMRLATTRGTNALLERKGVATALFITRGFADLLQIGTQQRPDIFALEIHKRQPLYSAVIEVDERIASDGTVLKQLNLAEVRQAAENLLHEGIDVAAVALMHSYITPDHEVSVTGQLRELGFRHISRSSEIAPFIRIVPRAETTVVDAYIAPVIQDYLARVRSALPTGGLHVMTSAGGLVKGEEFRAKDSLLSGPAGGVVGASLAGKQSGFDQIIAFDMGGTSTDVARFDGDYEYVFEHQVGDAYLVAPALAIESVAAGGGSICSYDGYRLRVGPESASANPGPACYGAGGPLTITDVNLLLGRLDHKSFEIPISLRAAKEQMRTISEAVTKSTGTSETDEALLQGFLDIANERMADAIRRVSLRKGYDAKDYALVAFGGAGGQHACAIAKRLGIETIIIPKDASLLSAHGLGHAVVERFKEQQVLRPLSEVLDQVASWFAKLTEKATQAVASEGVEKEEIIVRRRIANLRFVGQDSVLSVEYRDSRSLEQTFRDTYREVFGHLPHGRAVELESLRVVCSSKSSVALAKHAKLDLVQSDPAGTKKAYFSGRWQDVPFFQRSQLRPGHRIEGPSLIFEEHSATAVQPGWRSVVDHEDALILSVAGTTPSEMSHEHDSK